MSPTLAPVSDVVAPVCGENMICSESLIIENVGGVFAQVSDDGRTLASLAEDTHSLRELYMLGFYPGTSLEEAPFPYPSLTSYPGAIASRTLTVAAEGTRTLTPLTEN